MGQGKRAVVWFIKTAAVLAITGCVALLIYKVCFESVRTIFTNGNMLGEVTKHSLEEYDHASAKAQSVGLFHKEVRQLAADTAGLLASVAKFAVETGDATSDPIGEKLRELRDKVEELRAKATNLLARTTDRITLETPVNCLAYLKFADEKVLSQLAEFRRYEKADDGVGDFSKYSDLIDKFVDTDTGTARW